MNIKTIYKSVLFAAAVALSLTSCVKDDLYDTSHPQCGKIAITADWSARGEDLDIPAKWNIVIGDYAGEETDAVHTPDYLFAPGAYTLLVWNPADGITVSGNVAKTDYSDSMLGWLHTHTQQVEIAADHNHIFSAAMRQQVRQLTVLIKPQGDAAKRITGIEATLSGVASTLNFANNTHSNPVSVKLNFRKGKEGDQWAATVRLLGMTEDVQKLTGTITFADGNPLPLRFESELSSELSEFNAEKKLPLTLGGNIPATPTETDVTATIEKWDILDDWNVDAF